MKKDTQIVKGILEGCILKIAQSGEIYGYQAVEMLESYGFEVNEATVYPILTRLHGKGFLKAQRKESPLGPMRKYYSLTSLGNEELESFSQTWEWIRVTVDGILRGDEND